MDRDEERFRSALENEAKQLRSVHEISHLSLAHSARTLAFAIAADVNVQSLMETISQTVRREGGGAGGERAEILRERLRDEMLQQWQNLNTHYDVSSMTFILPDDSNVFLRMHEPEEFGDSLATIRPLTKLGNDLVPRSGFQIGRTNAGIRGVVPIMRPAADGGRIHVGTLEIGFDMNRESQRIAEQISANIAVLLDTRAVDAAMPTRYQPQRPLLTAVLLTATQPEGVAWYEAGLVRLVGAPENKLVRWNDRSFHVIAFPLHDWQGPSTPAVGSVLLWRDDTAMVHGHESHRLMLLGGIVLAYVLSLACIPFALRASRRADDERAAMIHALTRYNNLLLEITGEGIYGVTREGKVNFINHAACTMLGLRPADVLGQVPHPIFHHHRADGTPYPIEECPLTKTMNEGRPWEGEEWFIDRDGRGFHVLVNISPIYDADQYQGAIITFRDISELRQRQDELIHLSETDPLTGVPNRQHFLKQLEIEMQRLRRRDHPATLLMTNLDLFKQINDRYGHVAGDAVLKHYVAQMRSALRYTDIIGRLDGEEFAILLPGDGLTTAQQLAERLRQTIESNPAQIDDTTPIQTTASIGITELYASDIDVDAPLRRAGEALDDAKQAGRNCVRLHSAQPGSPE
jgi:diguanylate cyclase (GGDEF)-like protein/PAS domain S-box-containing protein